MVTYKEPEMISIFRKKLKNNRLPFSNLAKNVKDFLNMYYYILMPQFVFGKKQR
jgi:hypothetical protein